MTIKLLMSVNFKLNLALCLKKNPAVNAGLFSGY
jgi:hypothetical protein